MCRIFLLAFLIMVVPVLRGAGGGGLLPHGLGVAWAEDGGGGGSGGGGGDSGGGGSGGGAAGSDDGGTAGSDDGGASGSDDGADDSDRESTDHNGHGTAAAPNGGLFGGTFSRLFGGDRCGENHDHRRGEIIAYGLTATPRDALSGAGFRPLGDHALTALGQTVTRVGLPQGLSAEQDLRRATVLAPGAMLALNHLCTPEGTSCSGSDFWAVDLVGLSALADDACRDASPIAIGDTGVRTTHPALRGAQVVTRSFVDVTAASPRHDDRSPAGRTHWRWGTTARTGRGTPRR